MLRCAMAGVLCPGRVISGMLWQGRSGSEGCGSSRFVEAWQVS